MHRASLALLIAVSCLLAACGTATEIAEFDAEPVGSQAEPVGSQAAPEAPTNVPTEVPANTPTEDEPTADDEPSADDEPTPVPTPTPTAAPVEPAETQEPEALVVDYSRRGQVIEVIDDATGNRSDRIDGDLPAGGTLTYSFDVAAGQSVLLRQLGGCVFQGNGVLLADLDGPSGVNGAVFFQPGSDDCTDSSRYTAAESGTATLTVDDVDPDFSGTFSFEVYDVTNEPIVPLVVGDRVEPNSPIEGAGVFEFPGAEDVYSFEVEAGDIYLVRLLGCDLADTRIAKLYYEGVGNGSSSYQGDCDGSDRYEATSSGTVVIRADAGADHKGTGTYGFELVDLNAAATFALEVGDVVSPNNPANGAGQIEIAGEQDRYTLEMTKGQTVVLTQLGGCEYETGSGTRMEISGAGISTVFGFADSGDGCFDVKRVTAEFDGTVTMVVGDVRHEATGSYSFEVGTGAETIEEAEEVLEELDASEVDQERLITLDETVLFDFGSAELKSNANQALAAVADVLGVYITGDVRIVGHTDAVGTDGANQRLSQQRAEAVESALAELGVDADRMVSTGSGESAPIAPNENDDGSDNPAGRAKNRRVEIFFSTQE